MTGLMKSKLILDYLTKLIPNPKIELNYNHDYELLIAVMLSAQTTDVRVNQVTAILFREYPDLISLSNASISSLENILKPIGTFRKKAANVKLIATSLLEANTLNDRKFLESLPGVGRKTANVVLANLYNENVIAVDTHVKRVSIRLALVSEFDSINLIEEKLTKIFKNDLGHLHHRLVLFGRHYCKARNPKCNNCGLKDICIEKKRF